MTHFYIKWVKTSWTHSILVDNSEQSIFWVKKKIRYVTPLDLIKCLEQIKKTTLLLTGAPMAELPSNISTMPRAHMELTKFCVIRMDEKLYNLWVILIRLTCSICVEWMLANAILKYSYMRELLPDDGLYRFGQGLHLRYLRLAHELGPVHWYE